MKERSISMNLPSSRLHIAKIVTSNGLVVENEQYPSKSAKILFQRNVTNYHFWQIHQNLITSDVYKFK